MSFRPLMGVYNSNPAKEAYVKTIKNGFRPLMGVYNSNQENKNMATREVVNVFPSPYGGI